MSITNKGCCGAMILYYFQLPNILMLREVTLNEVRQQMPLHGSKLFYYFQLPNILLLSEVTSASKATSWPTYYHALIVHCNRYQVVLV